MKSLLIVLLFTAIAHAKPERLGAEDRATYQALKLEDSQARNNLAAARKSVGMAEKTATKAFSALQKFLQSRLADKYNLDEKVDGIAEDGTIIHPPVKALPEDPMPSTMQFIGGSSWTYPCTSCNGTLTTAIGTLTSSGTSGSALPSKKVK